MPKPRSMSGSVSQLHVRLPGRLSRWSLPSQHWRVYRQFVRQWPMSGRCGQLHLLSNRMDRMAVSFAYWKCSKIKFFNFWLVISDVMRYQRMRTGSLSEQRDVRQFDRPLLLQLYRRFRRRRLREPARRHLRQRAVPQQRQLHGSTTHWLCWPIVTLSVWLWWHQLRESHQLLFRSRALS